MIATRHRPGRDQQSGDDRIAPEYLLEVKRDRHEGQHLRHERADRGSDRQGEHRHAQQIDRQQRRGLQELAPDQHHPGDAGTREQQQRVEGRAIVTYVVDGDDEQTEEQGVEQRTRQVEAVRGARRAWQGARGEQRGDADRHIRGKQARAIRDRQDGGGDGRSDGGRQGDDQGDQADALAEFGAWVDKAHQRDIDAHDPGRANALQRAHQGQGGERIGQRASQRSEREYYQPNTVDAAIADDLAERG
jgi:hypothetical protein